MQRVFFNFMSKLPVATIIYLLLILFANLSFNFKWLGIALALDMADWLLAEMT